MLHRYYITLIFLFLAFQELKAQQLFINEFMASNSYTIADDNGDFEDWIELYNQGNSAVNLAGYGLSDDLTEPFRWVFPPVNLQPGSYLLIWASGKDRRVPGSPLHTNFSISAGGEFLLLTNPSGQRVDEVSPVPVPNSISYGRQPDGSEDLFFFSQPTPGNINNNNAYLGVVPDPVFSQVSGFFTEPFELTISKSDPNSTVFYTLNGSEPDQNSQQYSDPLVIASKAGVPNGISMIPTNNDNNPGPPYFEGWQPPLGEVFKVNSVRAVAMRPDYISSKVITHSYLVDNLGVNRYSLPVFFMNTTAANLFDDETGIYVPGNHNNMYQTGDEWERPVHLSFFEHDGVHAFADDLGVRTHGGTTRSRPRKSLRFYARSEYGNSYVNYKLFPEKQVALYKRFLLRNSGNDWDQAVFRDGFIHYLARDLNVETQNYRPAILFINGEYWGIHNIRDRYDEHYIYTHYGLPEEEFCMIENNSVFIFGNPDGVQHYNNMRSFMNSNSMAQSANYDYVKTQMDPESFADAQIINIFSVNTDWPGNNLNFWRRMTSEYQPGFPSGMDGRWRWQIYDTDFGFWLNFHYVPGVNEGATHNTLAFAAEPNGPSWPNPPWSTFLLRKLLANTGFKNYFVNRFADLLNTTLSESNVTAILDSIQQVLQPEMQEHINRWRRPIDMNEWLSNVQRMRSFAQQRPTHQREHIRSFFGLQGTANVVLNVNDPLMGKIRINTIIPQNEGSWTGIYFKGIPVTLEAIPNDGFIFSHWSGSHTGNQTTFELALSSDAQLTAWFIPDPSFPGDDLNPRAYKLSNGTYEFSFWDENHPEGIFPPHMLFLQTNVSDPGLATEMTHRYHIPAGEYHSNDLNLVGFPYKLTGRTRLNGLGADGISFINTGRGRDLGAAVLALDTRGMENIMLSWTAGTLIPNSRVYAIRLQYKTSPDGNFTNLTDNEGNVIEYMRSATVGHQQDFGPVLLPSWAEDLEYLQLRWKYYYTGTQLTQEHNRRDMLRLDNILVSGTATGAGVTNSEANNMLLHNYPNPCYDQTQISFRLSKPSSVQIALLDIFGNPIKLLPPKFFEAGSHSITMNLSDVRPGLYFYSASGNDFFYSRKLIVIQ